MPPAQSGSGIGSGMAPGRPVDTTVPFGSSGGRRLKVPVGFGYSVFLEGRQFGMLVVSVALYIFAAVVASEWIYLLSAAFLVALILGFVLPFFELAGLSATYSLPQEVAPLETAAIKVNIKRQFKLGPISWVVPTRALRMTVNMLKRSTDGMPSDIVVSPDPVYIDKLESAEWFTFPTPSLKRGIYYLDSIELTTCFPFGIVWWSRSIKMKKLTVNLTPALLFIQMFCPYRAIFSIALRASFRLWDTPLPLQLSLINQAVSEVCENFAAAIACATYTGPLPLGRVRCWCENLTQKLCRFLISCLICALTTGRLNNFELTVTLINSLVHLGHSLGHMPRLILNPSTESADLQVLMADLPHVPPGLALTAEILARVEPITKVAANRKTIEEDEPTDFETWSHVNDRPLLTVLPTSEKIMKSTPGKGDVVCQPVEIVEVSPNWQDESEPLPGMETQGGEKGVNFKSTRGASTKKSDRNEIGPTGGMVVARVESEGDFDGL